MRRLLLALGALVVLAAPGSARRVHLTCIDGCLRGSGAACDIDGRRDGVCTFDLCPSRCKEPVACRPCFTPVAVPLGKSVLKTPGVKFVLVCLAKGEVACLVPPTTTTTTSTVVEPMSTTTAPTTTASTTTTTTPCVLEGGRCSPRRNCCSGFCIFGTCVGCVDSNGCSAEQYCSKATGDCQGTGTCQPRPDLCPANIDP